MNKCLERIHWLTGRNKIEFLEHTNGYRRTISRTTKKEILHAESLAYCGQTCWNASSQGLEVIVLFWTLVLICLMGAAVFLVPIVVARCIWRRWRFRRLGNRAKIWTPTITAAWLEEIERAKKKPAKK